MMNTTLETEETIMEESINSLDDVKNTSVKYGCELIQHKATDSQLKNKEIPNDTFIVNYKINDIVYNDLCRGKKMVDIFDLYYDMLGKNELVSIEYGYGIINPRNWGYKTTEEKKTAKKRRRST